MKHSNTSLRRQRRLEKRRKLKMQEALWTAFAMFILLIMFGDDLIQTVHHITTWLSGTEKQAVNTTDDSWRDAAREVGGDAKLRKWYERGADPDTSPYDR